MHFSLTLTCSYVLFAVNSCSKCIDDCPKRQPEAFGHNGVMRDVNTFEGLMSPRRFFEEYVFKNRMLLLKHAAFHIPAFTKWDDLYLRKTAAANEQYDDVFMDHDRRAIPSSHLKLGNWNLYLDTYNRSDHYCINVVPLWLRHDAVFPDIIQCPFVRDIFYRSVMLHSSGNTRAYPHSDYYENVYCQLRGVKKFILVDTKSHALLREKLLTGKEMRLDYSQMNTSGVNYTEYPEFKDVGYYHVIIEPGDCLYNPTGWLHEVHSYGNNLALTYWFYPIHNRTIAPKELTELVDSSVLSVRKEFVPDFQECYKNRSLTLEGLKHVSRFGEQFTDYLIPLRITVNLENVLREGNMVDATFLLEHFIKNKRVSEYLLQAIIAIEDIFVALDENKDGILDTTEYDVLNKRQMKAEVVELGRVFDSAMRKMEVIRNETAGYKIVDIYSYLTEPDVDV